MKARKTKHSDNHLFPQSLSQNNPVNPQRLYIVAFLFILTLVVGAYLRLYKIADYLTFLGDEGRDVLIVKQMVVDGHITFLGPTASVGGFFLGPMYYYFMAPFLWLWRLDPVGPAVMVALFGIATIALLYKVGSDWFDKWVGITAASLYAVSPVVIAYSRSSWNPNLVPFFALLFVYLLWRITTQRKSRDYVLLGLVAGMGIQFHYLFAFLFVLAAFWFLLFERKKETIVGIGKVILGFIITFSPLLLFEIRHSFPNTRAILNFFLFSKTTGFSEGNFITTVTDVAFRSFGRLLFRMPNYELWNGFPKWAVSIWQILPTTTIFIGLGILVIYLISYIQKKRGIQFSALRPFVTDAARIPAFVLLFCWFFTPILLFGFYHKGIYDYYFSVFFCVPFLFIALVFRHLAVSLLGRVLAVFLFAALLFYNWQGRPFIYQPNRQLNQTKEIARAAVDMAGNEPYNFALITATNSDQAYRYFFEIWGKKPVTIENTDIDPGRKSVTGQLIIICENPDCQPLGNPLWEVAGFGRAEIAESKFVSVLKVFRLVPYKESNK